MRDRSKKYFPIVERFLGSGLTANAFSKQQGINKNTLSYWKKRYSDQNKGQAKGFAALSITGAGAVQITIDYTDGTRLTFSNTVDALLVRSLLPAFDS